VFDMVAAGCSLESSHSSFAIRFTCRGQGEALSSREDKGEMVFVDRFSPET